MSGQKPREIAARVLTVRSGGEFVEVQLERALGRAALAPADRRLCQELVYGVVRWQATLDWLINRKTERPPQKPLLQNLLRLGLYQIFWLERIPDHAAVHETVELAKKNGLGAQAGFINAVLRGFLRELDATKKLLTELKSGQPALGYSHPEWLAARWQARWGVDAAAQLMAWDNSPPKTFARVNTLKIDAARLLPQWRDENVEYDFVRCDWLAGAQSIALPSQQPSPADQRGPLTSLRERSHLIFELKSHPPLERLPSFQQGFFYVQDPSTLLAVQELAPQPGETILDLCAAPGGKLTFIAQLMRNEGRLVAHDTSAERLKLIRENCARLGVTCVEIQNPAPGDTHETPAPSHRISRFSFHARTSMLFDRILIDAPCSNTGVMRRRVDLRWRIRLEEIERLRRAQLELLQQAAPFLKAGGTLVYSTCSLEPEENQAVVNGFLSSHANFRIDGERELLPFADHVDGAYVAKLTKTT